MPNAKIPVIVAGSGHGCRVHVPALRAAGFEVVALVGSNAERTRRRAEKSEIPASFTDLDTAISKTGAIAVTVATPPLSHAPLVLSALSRNCHVLCEKPFARDANEAQQLLDAAQKAQVTHLLGNQFRLLSERRAIAQAIRDDLIGEPRFLTLASYNPLVADDTIRMPSWWFDEAQGGGWLGASGSHLIDQVRTWLGDIDSVSAALKVVSDRADVADDSFILKISFQQGTEGVLQQSGGAWGPPFDITRVAGSKGTVWLSDGKAWIADKEGQRELEPRPEWLLSEFPPSTQPGKQFLHLEMPPTVRLFELWRSAIEKQDERPIEDLASFEDGLETMCVIDAARRSAAKNGTLERVRS